MSSCCTFVCLATLVFQVNVVLGKREVLDTVSVDAEAQEDKVVKFDDFLDVAEFMAAVKAEAGKSSPELNPEKAELKVELKDLKAAKVEPKKRPKAKKGRDGKSGQWHAKKSSSRNSSGFVEMEPPAQEHEYINTSGLVSSFFLSSLLNITKREKKDFNRMKEPFPREFGFSTPGVFQVENNDLSPFGALSKKHPAAAANSSAFGKKFQEFMNPELVKSYAFSYPSESHPHGAWLYFDKDDKVLASRPVGGLGGTDEVFMRMWEGTEAELQDTKLKKIDANELCEWGTGNDGTNGWPVELYDDVKDFCWTPNCLMVEDEGDENNGCFVYMLKGNDEDDPPRYEAMVWSPNKNHDLARNPEVVESQGTAVRSATCSLVLSVAFFLSMSSR